MPHTDPASIAAILIVIFFGIGLHEYAHCKVADMAGDPTPGIYGRVTLNLFKHFDLVGTMMIIITCLWGYGIGWGKPSPMDPRKMRNPRWDHFAAVAAGPLSNIIQALVWAIIARVLLMSGQIRLDQIFPYRGEPPNFLGTLLQLGVFVNISLAFFNLLPVPPLDGHWLVGILLPEPARDKWFHWCRRVGPMPLLGLVFLGQAAPPLSVFRLVGPLILKLAGTMFGVQLS